MAGISKPCSVFNGYNFKQDKHDRVGALQAIKVGDVQFAADQEVKSPVDGAKAKVVAVLSDWFWNGGDAEPFDISGQVSTTNKQKIDNMLMTGIRSTEVLFKFVIYEYDPIAKKWFKCVHTNDADLKGLIQKQGSELQIAISATAGSEVVEPENFAFRIGIMSQRIEQDLHVATSETGKIVKKWGVNVS